MKCKECGAELVFKNDLYTCEFCGTKYFKDEVASTVQQNSTTNEFIVRGGVITAYKGNKTTVNIPEGILGIGTESFKNNLSIQSVVFSSSVVEIQNNAFEGCVNLRTISGYENVHFFGDDCFRLSGLVEVKIGQNVCKLGKSCFSNMPNIKKVIYMPEKDLKHNHTFFNCPNLDTVDADKFYFFPSFHSSLEVVNNPGNKRPTFTDAFTGTPFIKNIKEQYMQSYKDGICPECGGHISKGLFHAKCKDCGIDYRN